MDVGESASDLYLYEVFNVWGFVPLGKPWFFRDDFFHLLAGCLYLGSQKECWDLSGQYENFYFIPLFLKKKNVSFFHLPLCLILLETLISLKDRYLPSQLLRWRRAFENLTSFHSLYIILFPVLYFLSHHLLRCLKLLSLSQVPGIVLVCSLLALPL